MGAGRPSTQLRPAQSVIARTRRPEREASRYRTLRLPAVLFRESRSYEQPGGGRRTLFFWKKKKIIILEKLKADFKISRMINRQLHSDILDGLNKFPIVGLIGARQVGKTTLAKQIARELSRSIVYLDMELPADTAKLSDAQLYLEQHEDKLVILDEIQRMPGLFPLLRAMVDAKRNKGRFLILGSASPDLMRQSSESLAGRVVYFELAPFTSHEIKASPANLRKLWRRGGFPRSYLARSETESMQWRRAFIQTHLERDIPNLGIQIAPTTLRRFWTMLAHWHGQLWNANQIASSLGVSSPTVGHYLDTLEETFMVRRLMPFHANVKKRLVKSPKIYLRDSGLLHSLLGIQTQDDLSGHPALGASWEGWCVEQILSVIPPGWQPFFYRSHAGAEVDLFLQTTGRRKNIAVEIKYSLDPKPARGFWSALADLQPAEGYVIYPGQESYPLGKGVTAAPAGEISRVLK